MIITKMALPRRTFLRGVGATLALPLLDAMVPALTPIVHTAANPVRRLGFVYVPQGVIQDERWTPAQETGFELPSILESLAPVRKQLTIISGLDQKQAEALGDGGGGHDRGAGAWLNGVHPKKSESDVRAGITADQIAAAVFGKVTPLPSLELGLDGNQIVGACDQGYSCLYLNTLSWRTATEPLPVENNPGVIFERLFGDGGSLSQRRLQMRDKRSLLDSVTDELARIRRKIGAKDRAIVDGYTDSVREVEQRIQKAEHNAATSADVPNRPFGVPLTFQDHIRLMFDLQILAYRGDLTRVVTFQIAREISNRTYPEIGVAQGHHGISHHGDDPEKMAMIAKINAYHVSCFSEFLQKMQATPDGDGSLLDHSLMLYGSALGDGNTHSPLNLPVLLVGGGPDGFKGDRHLHYNGDPFMNVLLSMLDKVGVPTESLGDSTGPLIGL